MTAPVPSLAGRLAGRAPLRVLLGENDPAAARRSEASLVLHREFAVRVECVPSLSGAIRQLLEHPYDAVVLERDVDDASGLATLVGIRGAAPPCPWSCMPGRSMTCWPCAPSGQARTSATTSSTCHRSTSGGR